FTLLFSFFSLLPHLPPPATLFPYTTLFRSQRRQRCGLLGRGFRCVHVPIIRCLAGRLACVSHQQLSHSPSWLRSRATAFSLTDLKAQIGRASCRERV